MTDPRCSCESVWQGTGLRPLCRRHEKWLARDADGNLRDLRSGLPFMQSGERERGTWSSDLSSTPGVTRAAATSVATVGERDSSRPDAIW